MRKKQNHLRSVVFGKGLFFCGIISCFLLAGCADRDEELFWESSSFFAESFEEEAGFGEASMIYVYVCGAISSPGVYGLPVGARVTDALDAAGGLREDGAEDVMNLARILKDEERVYFPTRSELEEQIFTDEKNDSRVNLNTAGEELLCTLPGVGKAKAAAIIAYREKNGPFQSPEEIMQVSGIKESLYEKLRDQIKAE